MHTYYTYHIILCVYIYIYSISIYIIIYTYIHIYIHHRTSPFFDCEAAPDPSPSVIAVPLLGLLLFQSHALVHELVLQALEHADHLTSPVEAAQNVGSMQRPPRFWNQMWTQNFWSILPRILRI